MHAVICMPGENTYAKPTVGPIQRVFVNGDLRDESCTPRQPGVPIQAITYMYTYMCPAYAGA